MTKFNISQAAKLYGKDRSTIQRHIKQSKLSCGVDGSGHKVIDLSELIRAYGEPEHAAADTAVLQSEAMAQHAAPHTAAVLEEKIKGLEKELKVLEQDREERKEREAELRREKEKLLSIVDRQTLLIEDKREREKPEEQERKSSDRWLVYGLAVAVSLVTTATAYTLFKLWASSQ